MHFRDVHRVIVIPKDLTIVLATPLVASANVDLVLLVNIAMHVFLINMDSAEKVASLVIVTGSVPKVYSVTLMDSVQ